MKNRIVNHRLGKSCRFCDLDLKKPSAFPWDRVLIQTEHFFVIPTIGSLVPGWVMIVSKEHVLSMGHLDDAQHTELATLIQAVRNEIQCAFGSAVTFEHGAVVRGTNVGCGIDHAHVHVLPLEVDPKPLANLLVSASLPWVHVDGIKATQNLASRKLPYWFCTTAKGQSSISTAAPAISQLLRRIVARHQHLTEFDWRGDSQVANVLKTVTVLQNVWIEPACEFTGVVE